MAKSTKAPKKRATTSKKTNKRDSVLNSNWLKDSRVLVFALLFGTIGAILLFTTMANPKTTVDENEIATGYYDSKPTIISRDPVTDKKTYESYTASYLVLKGGTILCDDGNSEGAVYTGELGKGRVKQLQKEIKALDLSTVPSGDTAESHVGTFEGYVLVNSDSISAFSVYPDSQKPDKLAKMQEKIIKECEKATTRAVRGETKEFKLPKARSSASNTNAVNKLANLLSPKASATPPAPGPAPSIQSGFSNTIFSLTNDYRSQYGRTPLARVICLNDVAHAQAKREAEQNKMYHNPNLASEVTTKCGGAWKLLGENVGVEGVCDPQKLFNAYVASTTHRNNILDSRFNQIGIGTYKSATNGYCYNANVFGQW